MQKYSKKTKETALDPDFSKATAREILAMLDSHQRTIFISTYKELKGETNDDALTNAEIEMLFRAALAHVQYLTASRLYHECERLVLEEIRGTLDSKDPRRKLINRSQVYKDEMETKHREYMDLIGSLKLKRSQRLDKIKDIRNTFLDIQLELTNKAKQDSLVDDVKKINAATREELERIAKGEAGPDGRQISWLIGAFDIDSNE